MNDIVNKFLLPGDKFMPEMHLTNLDLLRALVEHLQIISREFKSLCKQEIQIIFTRTRMILLKLVFNMTWLMANIKT